MQEEIENESKCLAKALIKANKMICLAESCTGGMLAENLTQLPGSSAWFERAFVVYSYEAKHELLGVKMKTLQKYGAVSEAVAEQMAIGALKNSHADYAISITGIAGPTGATEDKPVGTVCFGFASQNNAYTKTFFFEGNRQLVRKQSCLTALKQILNFIEKTET